MAPDGPRAIPGNRCESESWKWWPGSDRFAKRIRTAKLPEGRGSAQADPSPSNQRHADFQDDGEPGSAPASRRRGTGFARADRTALADRAHTEPRARGPTEPRRNSKSGNGPGRSRPNEDRTVAAQSCRVNGGARPKDFSAHPKKQACASSATSEANSSIEFTSGLGS
jgi:hypothetical protein